MSQSLTGTPFSITIDIPDIHSKVRTVTKSCEGTCGGVVENGAHVGIAVMYVNLDSDVLDTSKDIADNARVRVVNDVLTTHLLGNSFKESSVFVGIEDYFTINSHLPAIGPNIVTDNPIYVLYSDWKCTSRFINIWKGIWLVRNGCDGSHGIR